MVLFKEFITITVVITVQVITYSNGNVDFYPESLAYFGSSYVPLHYKKENIGMMAAKVTVKGSVKGLVSFYQPHGMAPVLIIGKLTGFQTGRHGMYITQFGDLEQSCNMSGPVWDINFSHINNNNLYYYYYYYHGWPFNKPTGDLGSISQDANDSSVADFLHSNHFISLTPDNPANVLGRGLVIVTVSSENNSTVTTLTGCGSIVAAEPTQTESKN